LTDVHAPASGCPACGDDARRKIGVGTDGPDRIHFIFSCDHCRHEWREVMPVQTPSGAREEKMHRVRPFPAS
jgi:transposase-like protein